MKKTYWMLGGAVLAASCATGKNSDRPVNVVIILADDLGYGDLGCYGALNVQTPDVDRLAQEGTRFVNAYATASVSTPSRYSLLTGQYAWRRSDTDIAVGDAGMIIRPGQYTLADVFKNAGYRTAAFGKWHLGLGDKGGQQDWNAPLPSGLGDIGFDESYIMAATGDRVPCVFIHNGRVAQWDPEAPIEVSYQRPFEGEPLASEHPELLYNLRSSVGHNQAIVRWPGQVPSGAVSEAIVSQIDLYRSLGSLLEAVLPKGAAPDSRDGLNAWLGQDPVGRDYVIEQANDRTLSVRTAQWKYIEPSNGPAAYSWAPGVELGYQKAPQLYHLATDPAERCNVDAEHPDVLAQLQSILEKERLLGL